MPHLKDPIFGVYFPYPGFYGFAGPLSPAPSLKTAAYFRLSAF